MQKLIILVALLALGALSSFAQKAVPAKPAPASKAFVSAEGKFSILFPAEPEKGVAPMDSGGAKFDMYSFSVGVEEPASFYQLNYFDLAELADTPAGPIFDFFTDGFLDGVGGGRVLDKKDIKVGDSPGRIVRVAGEKKDFFKMKIVIVGARAYQMTAAFSADGRPIEETIRSSEALADKFLDSFTITAK